MASQQTAATVIFDTALARRRLARAAAGIPADFLLARAAADIVERLETVKRTFALAADLGSPTDGLATHLARMLPRTRIVRIAPLAQSNPAFDAVRGDAETVPLSGSLDLAVSALALHNANDLPGALVQIRRALKPDGLFLGSLVGGRTLHELRSVLTQADVETHGGASPRVAPFADVRDMGGLLQRAGFALPVADSEVVTVRYDTLFALMADLRAMGAANSLVDRTRRFARRAFFSRAATLYAERFGDADGRIRATFEIVSLSGWAPHESQQKPARRGSATISLAAALGGGRDGPQG